MLCTDFTIFVPMLNFKIDRFFMFLATLAIAFNLFSSSLVQATHHRKSVHSETVIKNLKDHKFSDQTRFEEIDYTEVEEDSEEESNLLKNLFEEKLNLFDASQVVIEQQLLSRTSPFLKPLRSKEFPVFLLLENIRV
jgi:hypothetical protein